MTQVHAPYHFVPLSKWVYMPDWAHLVSHDVPFEDGISGVIDYTLTNNTPLCVGDKQEKRPGEPVHVSFAKDPLGRPLIPSSSIKGMIRSVLEIASFGKFNQIDDHHFSSRDISNADTMYAKEIHESRAQAFWIKFDASLQKWVFREAEHTVIFHDDLNRAFGTTIQNVAFKQPAEKKYQQFPLTNEVYFDIGKRKIMGMRGKPVTVECATQLKHGQHKGFVSFSGFRPGKRERTQDRLNFSYLFYNAADKVKSYPDWQPLVNRLFEIHDEKLVDELKKHPNLEYGIPVFGRIGKNDKLLALGFAKMPRKLYKLSTLQVALAQQPLATSDNTFDMAELIFGTLRDNGFGLKSRVQFSDAICKVNTGLSKTQPAILGQPQASFLGGYIEQSGERVANELVNYQSGSKLKGWKRYPKQSGLNIKIPADLASKIDVQSTLEVIKPKATFTGRIVFHNLTKQELGALYWVLNFADGSDKLFHSLGHGKPLGAGAVQFDSLTLSHVVTNNGTTVTLDECQQSFIDEMTQASPTAEWLQSNQIQHLLSFGKDSTRDLTYMPLQSRDDIVTYTSALKGRQKLTLPNWQQLSRQDNQSQSVPASFASGRLSELFSKMESSSDYQLTAKEMELVQASKKAQQLEKLNSLSAVSKAYFELAGKFEEPEVVASKERRQALNSDVESLLQNALSEFLAVEEAQELFLLAKDPLRSGYLDLAKNKKNKDKLASRKALLKQFAAQYGLDHPWN